jgi:hypothetical protein
VLAVLLATGATSVLGAVGLGPAGASDRFPDVPTSSPFHGDIDWLADLEITAGFPDGTFRPTEEVSRQSMAAFLHRLWQGLGEFEPTPAPDPGFPDVPVSSPFFEDVAWMTHVEITAGFPDGTFRPTEEVSRQSMAAFLHRLWLALGEEDPVPLPDPGFPDVPASSPFFEDVAWMTHLGITAGFPDGTFRPTEEVSRQSMAAFLHRMVPQIGLIVDDAGDTRDADPGDGICTDADGRCTLRAAVDEANALAGTDAITIMGPIDPTLALAGDGEDLNATGDLDVDDAVLIDGNGTTVDAYSLDRVIEASDDISLVDVTLTGGSAPDGVFPEPGGALSAFGADVALDGVTISGNFAANGAALYVIGGTVTMDDTVVTSNLSGGAAVAIYESDLVMTGGEVSHTTVGAGVGLANTPGTLTDVAIVGNDGKGLAQGWGGLTLTGSEVAENGGVGLSIDGELTMEDSVVRDNEVLPGLAPANGAGIYLNGTGTIVDSAITGNHVASSEAAHGGGIYVVGCTVCPLTLRVEASTISDNVVESATHAGGGGGIYINAGVVEVVDSTIGGNEATGRGGGIHQSFGELLVEDSTVSGNQAVGTADAVSEGGGLYQGTGAPAPEVTIRNSTFSGNSASGHLFSSGGGLHVRNASIRFTTIAGNQASFGAALLVGEGTTDVGASILDSTGTDCWYNGIATVISAGYNLSSDESCELGSTGDVDSTASGLGVLQDNGGPTFTHMPGLSSAAINAIPLDTAGLCDGTWPTDQRGVGRPQGDGCDRGSVERGLG